MRAMLVSMLMLAACAAAAAVAQEAPAGTRPGEAKPAAVHKGAREALSDREALAMTGLEGLMSAPAERALPLLKKVLAGSMSERVKSRALFVLSQIDTPEAQSLLLEAARTNRGKLRREAIRAIGIGGNAAALDELAGVYAAGDAAVKRDVLQAYLVADRKQAVYRIALAAKGEPEFDEAVKILGAMDARQELRRLGEQRKDSESLIHAYAVSGDLESLRKLAAGPGDQRVRLKATQSIGIIGSEPAKLALRELYRSADSARIKNAALQGLLVAGDEQGVLELYRTSRSFEDKRALLKTLTIMGGDAALEAIDAALEGGRS